MLVMAEAVWFKHPLSVLSNEMSKGSHLVFFFFFECAEIFGTLSIKLSQILSGLDSPHFFCGHVAHLDTFLSVLEICPRTPAA